MKTFKFLLNSARVSTTRRVFSDGRDMVGCCTCVKRRGYGIAYGGAGTNLTCSWESKGSIRRAAAADSAVGPGVWASPLIGRKMTFTFVYIYGIWETGINPLYCIVLPLLDSLVDLMVVSEDIRGRRQKALKVWQ